MMSANGTFGVDLTPQEDIGSPVGRMLIKKTYLGDMNGSGAGQMISKRTENGAAVYYAIEEAGPKLRVRRVYGDLSVRNRCFGPSLWQNVCHKI